MIALLYNNFARWAEMVLGSSKLLMTCTDLGTAWHGRQTTHTEHTRPFGAHRGTACVEVLCSEGRLLGCMWRLGTSWPIHTHCMLPSGPIQTRTARVLLPIFSAVIALAPASSAAINWLLRSNPRMTLNCPPVQFAIVSTWRVSTAIMITFNFKPPWYSSKFRRNSCEHFFGVWALTRLACFKPPRIMPCSPTGFTCPWATMDVPAVWWSLAPL